MKSRKWIALLLVTAGMWILGTAGAENRPDLGMYDPYDQVPATVTWRELNVPRNTKLPVYSAPFESAWRGANGKACVNTNESFSLLGTVDGGAWGLVDYKVDSRSRRIGWIRMPEGAARPSEYGDMWLGRKLLRVTKSVTLTDDPAGNRKIRTMEAGEQVIGMFTWEAKNMLYIETRHEGKTTWGLIPADAAEDITETLLSVEGDTLIIREGVTAIGEIYRYEYSQEEDTSRAVTRIQPLDVSVGILDLYSLSGNGVRRIELPDSLRWIGMEGITTGKMEELRLGGRAEISDDAFYAARFNRIVLAADYSGGIPDGQYMGVMEWQTEEGNPLYRDIDGVLFSADGKRLLRYPNERQSEHYDVPAGTEEIAERAFTDDSMGICLRSISLPAGLKKIGAFAFSGCGYLLSLTVPLTVTDIAPSAFRNCVSLERLSLPPGMTAELGDWVKQEDYSSAFRGDNWGTYAQPAEKEEWELEYGEVFRSYPVQLDNAEGCGTVPVYDSPTAGTPSGTETVDGGEFYVCGIQNGRADLGDGMWVDLGNVRNKAENIFFRITDGEPADPARRTTPEGKLLMFSQLFKRYAYFYTTDDGTYGELFFPIRDTLLYRERTGDGTQMGIVVPEGDSAELLDAPEGRKLNHLYLETQAKVLEETEEWVRIETVYGTGWIDRNELMIVAEEPETDGR